MEKNGATKALVCSFFTGRYILLKESKYERECMGAGFRPSGAVQAFGDGAHRFGRDDAEHAPCSSENRKIPELQLEIQDAFEPKEWFAIEAYAGAVALHEKKGWMCYTGQKWLEISYHYLDPAGLPFRDVEKTREITQRRIADALEALVDETSLITRALQVGLDRG